MDNIYNGIWVKAGTNFSSARLPSAIATLDTAISNKQDALPAITNNQSKVLAVNSDASGLEWVEQSAGGSYTAGTGVVLNGTTFQIDETWLTNFVNNLIGGGSSEETITLSTDSNNPTQLNAGTTYILADGDS